MWWILLIVVILWLYGYFSKEDNSSNSNKVIDASHHGHDSRVSRAHSSIDAEHNITLNQSSRWAMLRQKAFEKYGSNCSSCTSTSNLQVHHKIPLSVGGTNDLDNLMILCESCHEKLHMTSFTYDNDIDGDNYGFDCKNPSSKISKLISALKDSRNVSIVYEKKDGSRTVRTITPKVISEENRRFYLRAYCHLRGTERTFRISRIKTIKSN